MSCLKRLSLAKKWTSVSPCFVAFISVGSYFIIKAIIGVFIDQFGYISGAKLLTERQKLWRDMHRMAGA